MSNKLPMSSMPLRPVDSKGYPGRTYKFFDGLNCASVWIWLKLHPVQVQSNILRISSRHKIRQTSALPWHQVHYWRLQLQQASKCPAVLTDDLKCNDAFEFKMAVQNVGKVDGSEAVIVYSKPPERIATTHINQVIGFQRVFVAAGEYEKIKFTFNFCKSLIIVD